MSEEPSSLEDIKKLLREGQKIQAIKLLREESGCGLKEAKDQVDAIQAKMIADGEQLPKATGCMGAAVILVVGLGMLSWICSG
ncbi:hypothetical protein DTL21_14125 [Bremerella cremea]|uniref:Large ribosomal subunit protein bL12 C-terminal domain-containing protein n=1 Tax=Blastopirellula marina TaxID=124 RepID=A0A2S8FRF5_9BACT|nr:MULTISPECIES: ribosomal protein L7/L12 [Pirellulaceae]PQO34640.1 hypothetical protein C5Y83_14120 [Blastopirellula marina]RCS47137.1 hypothetical protein DTL21_14125 [Bremerella cremea]